MGTRRRSAPARTPAEDAAFVLGFAACAAALAREHGEPSTAADLLRASGIGLRDLIAVGVEEFDLAPLRAEMMFAEQKR